MIECFHFNLPVHPRFNPFPNLEELRIIEQDVVDLNWLEDAPHLTTLMVFHTQLSDSTGIKFCPHLQKLILERNNLKKLPDITHLKQLEHLSVSGNPNIELDADQQVDTLIKIAADPKEYVRHYVGWCPFW